MGKMMLPKTTTGIKKKPTSTKQRITVITQATKTAIWK